MSKSVEAFRTISEVADELDVPKHVLRFWEGRFPQIRPMKRGGGRRFYRPQDVELLRGIRRLLQGDAYTIKGVQKILREQGIEHVKAIGRPAGAERRGQPPQPKPGASGRRLAPAVSAPADPADMAGVPASRRDQRTIILKAIRELDACRRLLRGQKRPPTPGRGRSTRP